MTAIVVERTSELWKFFGAAMLALIFAALLIATAGAARTAQPTEVKVVPCRTCAGKCKCPALLGSPSCLCPR